MNRYARHVLGAVTVALISWLPLAHAQEKPQAYHPLTNAELAQQGLWDQWVQTFNGMTARQKAEVMRRHVQMCLDSTELTEDQRAFVNDFMAKYLTEATYDPDPQKRAAKQKELAPIQEKALSVLGPELMVRFFAAKPPIAVLDAVKNDPAFK